MSTLCCFIFQKKWICSQHQINGWKVEHWLNHLLFQIPMFIVSNQWMNNSILILLSIELALSIDVIIQWNLLYLPNLNSMPIQLVTDMALKFSMWEFEMICITLSQRTSSSSRITMCNMNSYESLSLGTVEGEVVKSVEVNTKIKSGASGHL